MNLYDLYKIVIITQLGMSFRTMRQESIYFPHKLEVNLLMLTDVEHYIWPFWISRGMILNDGLKLLIRIQNIKMRFGHEDTGILKYCGLCYSIMIMVAEGWVSTDHH